MLSARFTWGRLIIKTQVSVIFKRINILLIVCLWVPLNALQTFPTVCFNPLQHYKHYTISFCQNHMDNQILIPYNTFQLIFHMTRSLFTVEVNNSGTGEISWMHFLQWMKLITSQQFNSLKWFLGQGEAQK